MRLAAFLTSVFLASITLAQVPPPILHAPPEPAGPCVSVLWEIPGKSFRASGVCVGSNGQKSLVLTNNHLFAIQPYPGAAFPLANYPLPTKVFSLDGKTVWKGCAVAGSVEDDLAVVVVEGVIGSASLADRNAAVGTEVFHKGIGSGFSIGKVLPYCVAGPCSRFASTLSSHNGDSGAGVFDTKTGKVIAINCGRHALPEDAPSRGTPAEDVRAFLVRNKHLTGF